MGSFLSKNEFPVDGRTILITGGSKGLGLAAACQIAAKGANIIIVARGESSLREAIVSISNSARSPDIQRFHYISADVTTAPECARVVAESIRWNHGSPPDIVWCCSGSSHPTLFIDTPIDQFQTMMDSNYFSCVYMAHAVLNVWLRPSVPTITGTKQPTESSSGAAKSTPPPPPPPARHIIFTGSFVSFYSFAGFTPYSPSKAAVRSLSDSLSQEMNLYAAARARARRLPGHDADAALEEGDQVLRPDECARWAIRGLEGGEELVPTSAIIRLVMTSAMGGSVRGGFWKGLANTLLGWVVLVVMVFVRWEMDTKVARWGRRYGPSGMAKEE
ncbi:NAD(P)-binding protein [Biscogniauxia marginata]|nr:NAD(P)-binding protein [Biscogniauxia marginata]